MDLELVPNNRPFCPSAYRKREKRGFMFYGIIMSLGDCCHVEWEPGKLKIALFYFIGIFFHAYEFQKRHTCAIPHKKLDKFKQIASIIMPFERIFALK